MALNAISLFSGAMGLDIGVERAGFCVKVAVEMNNSACNTIRLNKPLLPIIDKDITTVSSNEILEKSGLQKNQVDLIVGGPPCQSFSTAGRRRSLKDTRGNCIFEFIRVVNDIRPKAFIMENVRGLLSSKVGIDGLKIIKDGKIKYLNKETLVVNYIESRFKEMGYKIKYKLLNAADYGVPQKRQRVFFVGTLLSNDFYFPEPTNYKEPKKGQKGWMTFADVMDQLKDIEFHTYKPYTGDRKRYMEMVPVGGGNWRDLPKELQPQAMGKAFYSGGGKVGFFRRIKINEPAPTLVTSPGHKATMLGHPTQNRPLSVEEYKAIQQFPIAWKIPGSMSQQYMLIGNAVPVGLAYAVSKQVYEHIIEFNKSKR